MPSQHHLLRRAVPLALLGSLLIAASVSAAGPTTRRLSLDSAKVQGDGDSQVPAISADGRYVAFSSYAANLVGGDTNGVQDVFVRDRTTKTTTRLSVSSVGAQSDGESQEPAISADGRYVAFCSSAANLVGGDTNNSGDVFVRDRTTNTTTRLSVSSVGLQGDFGGCSPSISADGRYVAFESSATNLGAGRAVVSNSDTNNRPDVFVRDRTRNTTTRLSVSSAGLEGDDSSYNPAISADGRYVAFSSYATNLVGSDTNGTADVFVRDRTTNTTTRLSVSSAGLEGNVASFGAAISADGRYVAFESRATNLVGSDTNGTPDVFVRDRTTNTTRRLSVSSVGLQGDSESGNPAISADGRYVAFESFATNLVGSDTSGDADVFVRDRTTNTTTRLSVSSAGLEGNVASFDAAISADGRYVAFDSYATNLVGSDTNGTRDVFVRDRLH